jgi:hypothetical protein
MSNKSNPTVATMGIDIGKNSFHVVGLDQCGAIVLRQRWSRRQIEVRLANIHSQAPFRLAMEVPNSRTKKQESQPLRKRGPKPPRQPQSSRKIFTGLSRAVFITVMAMLSQGDNCPCGDDET